MALAAAVVAPATAQDHPGPGETEPGVCTVFAVERAEEGLQEVRAACWGTGLVLGLADSFQVFSNFELQATIVELSRGAERRVFLLRPDQNDRPLIEDISANLAAAAGRAPWSSLEGLTFDYAQFMGNASIVVEPGIQEDALRGSGTSGPGPSGPAIRVQIDDHIAQDKARIVAAGATADEGGRLK